MTKSIGRLAAIPALASAATLLLAASASHAAGVPARGGAAPEQVIAQNERFSPLAARAAVQGDAAQKASRAVVDRDALQNQAIDDLAKQVAALQTALASDRATIATLRSEVDRLNVLSRPPHGYTKAFITKNNFDHLGDFVGIEYYAPINEK